MLESREMSENQFRGIPYHDFGVWDGKEGELVGFKSLNVKRSWLEIARENTRSNAAAARLWSLDCEKKWFNGGLSSHTRKRDIEKLTQGSTSRQKSTSESRTCSSCEKKIPVFHFALSLRLIAQMYEAYIKIRRMMFSSI